MIANDENVMFVWDTAMETRLEKVNFDFVGCMNLDEKKLIMVGYLLMTSSSQRRIMYRKIQDL